MGTKIIKKYENPWLYVGWRWKIVDKPGKRDYSNSRHSGDEIGRDIAKNKELMTMALAEKHMASQLKQSVERTTKRVPLSQAIKKVGVRSAFGVTAADLHLLDRRGK